MDKRRSLSILEGKAGGARGDAWRVAVMRAVAEGASWSEIAEAGRIPEQSALEVLRPKG